MTIVFSSGSLSNAISSNVAVSAGAFAKLQLLVPGESAAPGTASGKTGTPVAQIASSAINVTVNAVDANWNQSVSASDMVRITSSTNSASLPANSPLTNGTQISTVSFNTNGSFTLTATDIVAQTILSATSPSITVTPAQFTPATGGNNISADTVGGAFTSLTGPVYSEAIKGNVGVGTIILNVPSGWTFDTGGVAPAVRINGGKSTQNINAVGSGVSVAMTSVTSTQLTFTVSSVSSVTNTLTWQNVRVRPLAGTPLASGNLFRSGTANVVGLSTNANLGTLREIAGAANKLVIQTQPSSIATAGVPFAQQPLIQVQDRFGNVRNAANSGGAGDNSAVVTAASTAGSGALQGTTGLTALNGVVAYTNLSHTVATNIAIIFSSTGLSSVISTTIAVSPGTASQLAFTTQPANATAGGPFGAQPIVKSQDRFGNNSTNGLPASLNLTVALSSGSGPLQGTTTLDIGAAAGNGIAVFSNLELDAAGANNQLSATASGLSSALSATFAVSPAAATTLVIQTQPPVTATAGANFSPVPVVRLQDAFGNLVTTDSSTVVTATLNTGTATLQGTTGVA